MITYFYSNDISHFRISERVRFVFPLVCLLILQVLNEVYGNPVNRLCADCGGSRPHWAVLHMHSVVCSFCAGIHRQYWPFRVKSLRMDIKIWTLPLINVSCVIV